MLLLVMLLVWLQGSAAGTHSIMVEPSRCSNSLVSFFQCRFPVAMYMYVLWMHTRASMILALPCLVFGVVGGSHCKPLCVYISLGCNKPQSDQPCMQRLMLDLKFELQFEVIQQEWILRCLWPALWPAFLENCNAGNIDYPSTVVGSNAKASVCGQTCSQTGH